MRTNDLSAVVAGMVAVTVSYAGPLLVVLQAASAAGLERGQIASWIWAISIGSGVSAIALSIRFRTPVITAWSTPGAALLVAALPGYGWGEAIGAFLVAALLLTGLGLSGLFDRVAALVPRSIAAALLAGILFRFGARLFESFTADPALVGAMFAVWLAARRFAPRWAVALVLIAGTAFATATGAMRFEGLALEVAVPVWTAPQFTLSAVIGLGLPLALVSLTGQFVPGVAVMRAFGYGAPAGPMVWVTSALAAVLAPFGAHGVNLAAITAAICSGPEAHPDAGRRWIAGVALGVFYIVVGTFGATLAALFSALPAALVATGAGLALLGAIIAGLVGALAEERDRDAAAITFLVSASGVSFLGLGSAFWGLAIGLLAAFALGSLGRGAAAAREAVPSRAGR